MIHLYIGTDRMKVRDALNVAIEKHQGVLRTIRITDAHTLDDLAVALGGGGLFDEARTVILEGVLANEEMCLLVVNALPAMSAASDAFHLVEEKLDTATKKLLEKHTASITLFNLPKKAKRASNIFALADAFKRGDRKRLWIGYQQALIEGDAAEAIHGVLFWGAKDMLLKAHDEKTRVRARVFIVDLAQLPHEARRASENLSYALERFVLSRV